MLYVGDMLSILPTNHKYSVPHLEPIEPFGIMGHYSIPQAQLSFSILLVTYVITWLLVSALVILVYADFLPMEQISVF